MSYKNYFKSLILLILLLLNLTILSNEYKYGLINKTKVNIYNDPSIQSKKIGELKYGDLICCNEKSRNKEKINDDLFFWYKISKNCNKAGWIYGKYINLLNQKPESENFYKNIILNRIKRTISKDEKISQINIHFDKGKGIFFCDFTISDSHSAILNKYIYKIDGKNLYHILTCSIDEKVVFYKNYIFCIFDKIAIRVYDTTKKEKGDSLDELSTKTYPDSIYNQIAQFHIREIEKKNSIKSNSGSYLKFDTNNYTLTVHLREQKGKPMKIEKYKFKDGKFIQIQ